MPYPAPPAPRIAYHRDGSIAMALNGSGLGSGQTPMASGSALAAMNSDGLQNAFFANWHRFRDDRGQLGSNNYWGGDTGVGRNNTVLADLAQRPAVVVIFPRPMRLRGLFLHTLGWFDWSFGLGGWSAGAVTNPVIVETSTDTTNGIDGTWIQVYDLATDGYMCQPSSTGGVNDPPSPSPGNLVGTTAFGVTRMTGDLVSSARVSGDSGGVGWRSLFGAGTTNVRAVRLSVTQFAPVESVSTDGTVNLAGIAVKLHLYGYPEDGYDPHRLEIVSEGGGDFSTAIQDVKWGDSVIVPFQVSNLSETLTATGVTVSLDLPNPNVSTAFSNFDYTLSGDGINWQFPEVFVGDLGPSSSSDVLYARFIVPQSNLLGPWSPSISAEAEEWIA